jgi:hypothetical protein
MSDHIKVWVALWTGNPWSEIEAISLDGPFGVLTTPAIVISPQRYEELLSLEAERAMVNKACLDAFALIDLWEEYGYLKAQLERVCVRWLHVQDDYGIWYSMTDCGLSENIGEAKSEIQDGRNFCPCCGGKQALKDET